MGARGARPVPLLRRTGSVTRRRLPPRVVSSVLTVPGRREVLKIDAVEACPGDRFGLQFEDSNSAWRQGVWLGTEGTLEIAGKRAPQFVLWADTAPNLVEIACVETDGLLRLYNVWNSGRKAGEFESQSHTSGMLVEHLPDGSSRYRCNDIGDEPDFTRLIFRIRRLDD